jgi:hypothetical protein
MNSVEVTMPIIKLYTVPGKLDKTLSRNHRKKPDLFTNKIGNLSHIQKYQSRWKGQAYSINYALKIPVSISFTSPSSL